VGQEACHADYAILAEPEGNPVQRDRYHPLT